MDKVQRYKDSLKYFKDLKKLREREDLDGLSDFFRSMAIRPTSEELEKPIAIDDNIESQLENTAGVGRELTEEELYQNLSQPQQQSEETTTVEDFGGVTKAIEEAKQRTTEEPKIEPLDTTTATPTEQQIIDANTPRLGDEINLVKKRESVGDINYLQKGKTETENVEEDVKEDVNDRKKMLESVMLDEAAQNLIETVDMFKPYTKPFESKEIGKIYISNVINNVLPYLPEGINKNKFKSLLMYGADKESTYGHDAQTYKFRKTKQGTVGHGGIQQVTTSGFKLNLLDNPSEEAKKMILNLKEKTGIHINKIKNSKKPNADIQRFLETPFGSNFAASIFYINNLTNPGKSGEAARKLFNSDKYNEKDFRDIFYKGSKKYDEVSKVLKDNKIRELKTGGRVESNPYKRQPRFI